MKTSLHRNALTSPNCPVADSLPKMVKENINSIERLKSWFKISLGPPWTKIWWARSKIRIELMVSKLLN